MNGTDLLAGWVEAIGAVAAATIALVALVFAIRGHSNARETYIQDMRQKWALLSDDWNLLLLILYGSDFHYAYCSPELREVARGIAEDHEATDESAAEVRRRTRPIARFFGMVGEGLLSGRWTPNEAYAVFGPDVARQFQAILWLSNRPTALHVGQSVDPGIIMRDLTDWRTQIPEFNMFDEQDCIIVCGNAIRAQQCLLGDTYAHFVVGFAWASRTRPGDELRTALSRAVRRRGRLLAPRAVRRLFRRAGSPKLRRLLQVEEMPILNESDYVLFRRPFESSRSARRRVKRQVQSALDHPYYYSDGQFGE